MKHPQSPYKLTLFRASVPVCAIIAAWGIAHPDALANYANEATAALFRSLDWFFMSSITGLLVLSLFLAFSRFGRLKLGGPDDEPEFSTMSWLAMLFSAGMGVGLMFWGVAEPIIHYTSAPGVAHRSPAAARHALVLTGLHWGLHAWALYSAAALVLAYFGFRRKTPYLPGAPIRDEFRRSKWAPPVAVSADFIAILAVAFGVAGAVAMGVLQLQTGLHVVGGPSAHSKMVAAAILCAIVVSYMTSAATSLDKGIKWLSNINMAIAIIVLLLVLCLGPTAYLLKGLVTSIGDYITSLPGLSLRLYPYAHSQKWIHNWTLTYFIWWIAWAPFVGVFIARISKGRTIREFVFGVLFGPTVFSLIWFGVFGGTALFQEIHGSGGIAQLVHENVSVALFSLYQRLPMTDILSAASLVLVFTFLVTSVDSATFVLGMLTSRGSLNPPTLRKVAWGILLGLLSGALMLTGHPYAIRGISIIGAIPFTFILLLQVVAFMRALVREPEVARRKPPDKRAQGEQPPENEPLDAPATPSTGERP